MTPLILIFLYCPEKTHDNKNSVVKIQKLVVDYESQSVKMNPVLMLVK